MPLLLMIIITYKRGGLLLAMSRKKIASYLRSSRKDHKVYNNKPLKFIHTHFDKPQFDTINNFLITKLNDAKMYKELLSIYRCKYNKWIISLPRQPMKGLVYHKNDSFREIPLILKQNHVDIDVCLHQDGKHCKLLPNIILYDRPTLEWIDQELNVCPLVL